jgi:hypothetical protein
MKTIECWSIEVWDGCDRCNHKFYVATEEEAKKWMENNSYDRIEKKTFVIYDTLGEAIDNDLATIKQRVIAKLTPLERRAMGVA